MVKERVSSEGGEKVGYRSDETVKNELRRGEDGRKSGEGRVVKLLSRWLGG